MTQLHSSAINFKIITYLIGVKADKLYLVFYIMAATHLTKSRNVWTVQFS